MDLIATLRRGLNLSSEACRCQSCFEMPAQPRGSYGVLETFWKHFTNIPCSAPTARSADPRPGSGRANGWLERLPCRRHEVGSACLEIARGCPDRRDETKRSTLSSHRFIKQLGNANEHWRPWTRVWRKGWSSRDTSPGLLVPDLQTMAATRWRHNPPSSQQSIHITGADCGSVAQ